MKSLQQFAKTLFQKQNRILNRQKSRRQHAWNQSRQPLLADIQKLEDRTLLAGNVTVALDGDHVTLEGDDADNDIRISRVGDWIVVTGMNGTTVGGLSEYLISGRPILRDNLTIKLHGGNDSLLVQSGVGIRNDFKIETGDGDDFVHLDSVLIGDDLHIYTGTGNDTVLVTHTTIRDDLGIFSEGGNNTVSVTNTHITDTHVIATGDGDDIVTLLGNTQGHQRPVATSAGNDTTTIEATNDGRTLPGSDSFTEFTKIDAIDDSYTLIDKTLTVNAIGGVRRNDISPLIGGGGTANIVTEPQQGTVTLNKDGSFTYTANDDFNGSDTFTYRLSTTYGGTDIATVTITANGKIVTLEIDDFPASDVVQSNETLVTKKEKITITGKVNANAKVDVDRDGDGKFDDGTTTADADGKFSVEVTLLHNDTNKGANTLQVRATLSNSINTKTEELKIHYAIGSIVRFTTSAGTYDVELFDTDAPKTVANFKSYFARYKDSIIHRSVKDFIIQGGGFDLDNSTPPGVDKVTTDAAIDNEFKSKNKNERGTLSMAQLSGNINSGTSQWFFNLVKNSSLDNVPHTVFGRVIGAGMKVIDEIAALKRVNLNGVFDETALGTVPLKDYTEYDAKITGTASVTAGSVTLTGTGTKFSTELKVGMAIRIGAETFTVHSIQSDTKLTLGLSTNSNTKRTHTAGATNVPIEVNKKPTKANYVVFSDIDEILDA